MILIARAKNEIFIHREQLKRYSPPLVLVLKEFSTGYPYSHRTEIYPLDTGCKLNVYKTFKKRSRRLMNILYTLNILPLSKE